MAEENANVKFKASNGWLEKFKKRNFIRFKKLQGEAGDIDNTALNLWQQHVLGEHLKQYPSEDVFNFDEAGLFWKVLPNKTLTLKGTFF